MTQCVCCILVSRKTRGLASVWRGWTEIERIDGTKIQHIPCTPLKRAYILVVDDVQQHSLLDYLNNIKLLQFCSIRLNYLNKKLIFIWKTKSNTRKMADEEYIRNPSYSIQKIALVGSDRNTLNFEMVLHVKHRSSSVTHGIALILNFLLRENRPLASVRFNTALRCFHSRLCFTSVSYL